MTISAEQFKNARMMLGWSRIRMMARLNVGEKTISNFEAGLPCSAKLDCGLAQSVFEAAGVEFIPENGGAAGVRLKKSSAAEIDRSPPGR